MPTVTALQVITDAFQLHNIYMPGDPVVTADSTTALRFLNLMIGQWAQQALTIPAEARLVFPLVVGKGSSTNPYTIGVGPPAGDLNTPKPANRSNLTAAGLLLNVSNPPVEIPRGLMTDDAYHENRIKDLTSTLFTSVYYLPTFAGGLGQIFLWPVPTDMTNSLVLYVRQALSTFADLTTVYSIPDGYDLALANNLAVVGRLAKIFGRIIDDDDRQAARDSLMVIMRSNIQLVDLPNDFAGIGTGRTRRGYNLQTGE